MKPAPSDWPRCTSALFYQDAYAALDPEGHPWWITQRVRNPPQR